MSTPAADAASLTLSEFAKKYGGPVGLEAKLQIGAGQDWVGRVSPPAELPSGRVPLVFTYGQSNALGDTNTLNTTLATLARTNYRLTDGVTPNVRFNIDLGGAAAFPTGLASFEESTQSTYSATCLTGFLVKTGMQGAIALAAGKAATSLANLSPGTTPWTRLQQNLASVKALGYDTREEVCIFWQGEQDNIANTSATYQEQFLNLLADFVQRGQNPVVIAVAVSAAGTLGSDTMGASKAFLDLFHARHLEIAGPAYGLPFAVSNIHPTAVGQTIMGEMVGRVYNALKAGERFRPVYPVTVQTDSTYDGTGVRVDFYVPAGSRLRCDALNHTSVTGSGFRFVDSDGTTFVAAALTKVVGNSVYLEPQATLNAGSCKLRYALDYKAHASNGAQGAGNVFAETGETSAILPIPILHWAIPFEKSFTVA